MTHYLFAVIIPNRVLDEYEIGESEIFCTYDTDWQTGAVTENSREWLQAIDKQSVKHRAGLFFDEQLWNIMTDISVVTSRVELENAIS